MTATIDTETAGTEAAAKETQTAPTPAQTPDAPLPQADSKYADSEVQQELAAGVVAARAAGFSRTVLERLTELTPAQLWRIEQGRAHKHEVAQVRDVLDKIKSGEVQPPQRPGKVSETQVKLNAVKTLLEEAQHAKTKADILEKIGEAIEALAPSAA